MIPTRSAVCALNRYTIAKLTVQGLHSLETLLESHIDKAFDKFTAWALRNAFEVPSDLEVVLVGFPFWIPSGRCCSPLPLAIDSFLNPPCPIHYALRFPYPSPITISRSTRVLIISTFLLTLLTTVAMASKSRFRQRGIRCIITQGGRYACGNY